MTPAFRPLAAAAVLTMAAGAQAQTAPAPAPAGHDHALQSLQSNLDRHPNAGLTNAEMRVEANRARADAVERPERTDRPDKADRSARPDRPEHGRGR
ncbi:MAG: hypothetical protein ACM31L_08565 [Actinomycetota bacterium]